MKALIQSLRFWLVCRVKDAMARLSRVIQVGSPHGRAPTVRREPATEETLGSFEGGKVYSFDHAIVAGAQGGLMISDRNEIFSILTHYYRGVALHPGVIPLKVSAARHLSGTGAYLCTPQARGNYYHWLVDLVPRLWLVEQAGFASETLDHVLANGDDRLWERETLLACGIRPEAIRYCSEKKRLQMERFQIDSLIVPGQVANPENFAPWKARFLRRLFPLSKELPTRRLFCGRKDATTRRLVNEDELFTRLKEELGFERAEMSGKSVAEQAQLFSSACIVVAVHGAALTNMVFASPQSVLIEIQSRESPQAYFTSICSTVGVRASIVPAQPTRKGTSAVDRNYADILLSAAEIDAIISQAEKDLAS